MTRHRKRRVALKALAAVLVGWLVVDKVLSVAAPTPTVGHWRSAADAARYRAAYDAALATLPAPTETRDVVTSVGTVHVLRWGGGSGEPVLLLPGRSSGAPMWAENLPDLVGRRPVIALDPIGDAGLSSQTVPLAGVAGQAEWVGETLAGLGVSRAHVVGHSFGGATATALALHHPELVASLTLLEPVMVIEPLPASTYFWATVSQLPVPQSWRDRALAEIGGTTIDDVRRRTPVGDMIDAGSSGYVASVPMPSRLDDEQWRAMSMPLRVDIAGGRSLAGGEQAAARIRRLVRAAHVTVWPNATHSLPMQEHAALAQQLLAFWRDAD